MKRYHFNIRNAENEIIHKWDVAANNLDQAKQKISHRIQITYTDFAFCVSATVDYEECNVKGCCK